MTTQKIETKRHELQAERQRLSRLLAFCYDEKTRATHERRVREIDATLDQVHAMLRVVQPRAQALSYGH